MKERIATILQKGVERPIPQGVSPMLCTLLSKPFSDPNYVFEVKWDGYRIIAYKTDKVKLQSRGGHDYTRRYPSVRETLSGIDHDLVVDGEVIAVNSEGKPDFDALQKISGQRSGVVYYVFDLLWLDGRNLMKLPLTERKRLLREVVVADNGIIRYSDDFDDGLVLFEQIQAHELEGIVAKRKNSRYTPGKRGTDWYKTPAMIEDDFIIGGYVESEKRLFRTLLFGTYEGGELKWLGHAGGGYKDREMPAILQRLQELETPDSPFVNEVDYQGVVHWVRPEVTARIRYATFTAAGKIRKPAIFLGFKEEKDTSATSIDQDDFEKSSTNASDLKRYLPAAAGSNWPVVESEQIRHQEQVTIDNCRITLYNVDRKLWKGVTKADLIRYYHDVSDYILPHLQNRALSLHLKLNGPYRPGLYIKDMEDRGPECAEIFRTERRHKKPEKRDTIDYLVCNNVATLLYIINLGCIDLNPWTSRTQKPASPDYIIIDLDPSDGDFEKVIATAKAAKEFFDEHHLQAFIKSSGKTGMHLYLPCSAFSFPQARNIAENICKAIHARVLDITTTAVAIADRGNRLYLDPNQNDYADTVAAPYSVRPFKIPAVSTPLEWSEIDSALDPAAFTIHSIQERLKQKGDLFEQVFNEGMAERNNAVLRGFGDVKL